MKGKLWMLTLGCVFSIALGGSELYKWVDENGVVHYTDKPPQDQQSIEVMDVQDETKQGESVYNKVIEQQRTRREYKAQQREQEAVERKAKQAEKSEIQVDCSRAIHYLNILKKQCRVFYDGAGILRDQCPGYYFAYEGQRSYIDDNERQELIEHYSRIVGDCSDSNRK